MSTYKRQYVDGAAWVPGTDKVDVAGFLADATIPPAVDDGDIGAAAMTLRRALHTSLRDDNGNALADGGGIKLNIGDLAAKLDEMIAAIGLLMQADTLRLFPPTIGGGRLDSVTSVGAIPLPPGASTAARQVSPGTVNAPSPDVASVQGIAGGKPVEVTLRDLSAQFDALIAALGLPMQEDTLRRFPPLIAGGTVDSVARVASQALPDGASIASRQVRPGDIMNPSPEIQSVQGVPNGYPQAVIYPDLAYTLGEVRSTLADILEAVQRPAPDPASTNSNPYNVTATTTSTKIMDANGARKGAVIYNDSLSTLSLKYGAGAAGSTAANPSFTYEIPQFSHWEMPWPPYRGEVHGIWNAASGAARVTDCI